MRALLPPLILAFAACNAPIRSTPKLIPQPGCQKVDCAEMFEGMAPLDPNGDDDQDGVKNQDDGAPLIPEDKDGVQDTDGIPDPDPPAPPPPDPKTKKPKPPEKEKPSDVDNDGIPDAFDQCYKDLEDKDNFEDADGCPEADNDKDGMPDDKDTCPNVPGTDCK